VELDDTDDQTSRRIAVRRLAPSLLNSIPGGKFGTAPGYQRLENFFGNQTGAPSVEELFDAGPNTGVTALLRSVQANEANLIHMAVMTATALHHHPEVAPALESLASDQGQPGDTRKAAAGALGAFHGTTNISPVLLRCLLGADAGGPLALQGEDMGALLAMLGDGTTCGAAITLIGHGNAEQRAVARGFLDHKINVEKTSDNDYRKARVSAGGQFTGSAAPLWKTQPLLAVALNFAVPVKAVRDAMQLDPSTTGTLINSVVTGSDRKKAQNLARCGDLFASNSPHDLFGTFMGMASNSSWIPRETAGIFAQAIGNRIMQSDDSDAFSEKLTELCSDGDSDVTREASAACAMLGMEA